MQDTAVLERGGSVDGEPRTDVPDGGISEGDKAFLESNGIDPDTLAEGPQQNSNAKPAEDEYRQMHLRKEHGLFRRIWNLFRRNKSKGVEDNLKNALNEGNLDEAKDMFRKDVAEDLRAGQMESQVLRESQPLANSVQRRPQTPPMR